MSLSIPKHFYNSKKLETVVENTPEQKHPVYFACMSFCQTIFKSKAQREKEKQQIIYHKCVANMETIKNRIRKTELQKSKIEIELLKTVQKKEKSKARILILRKRRCEKTIQQYETYVSKIEDHILELEQQDVNNELLDSMSLINNSMGANKIKKMSKRAEMTRENMFDREEELDELKNIMEETFEHNPLDDELENELDVLFGDSPPPSDDKIHIKLPDVPKHEPSKREKENKTEITL